MPRCIWSQWALAHAQASCQQFKRTFRLLALSHALIVTLFVITLGSSPRACISASSSSAHSDCCPFSHVLAIALYVITMGSSPCACSPASRSNARSGYCPFSHALIVAQNVITLGFSPRTCDFASSSSARNSSSARSC